MIFQAEDYLNILQITKVSTLHFYLLQKKRVPLLLQVDEEYKYCIDGVIQKFISYRNSPVPELRV